MLSEQRLERLQRWYHRCGAEQGFDHSTGCRCPDDPHCNVLHDLALEVGKLLDDVARQRGVLDVIDKLTKDAVASDTTARTIRTALRHSGVTVRKSEPELAEWTP